MEYLHHAPTRGMKQLKPLAVPTSIVWSLVEPWLVCCVELPGPRHRHLYVVLLQRAQSNQLVQISPKFIQSTWARTDGWRARTPFGVCRTPSGEPSTHLLGLKVAFTILASILFNTSTLRIASKQCQLRSS